MPPSLVSLFFLGLDKSFRETGTVAVQRCKQESDVGGGQKYFPALVKAFQTIADI